MQFQEYELAVAACYETIGKPQGLTQVTWSTKQGAATAQAPGSRNVQPVPSMYPSILTSHR